MLRVRAEARRNGSVCAAVPLAHGPSCVLRAPRRDRCAPRGWGGEVMDRRCGDARSRRHASAATSVATVTAIQYAPTALGGRAKPCGGPPFVHGTAPGENFPVSTILAPPGAGLVASEPARNAAPRALGGASSAALAAGTPPPPPSIPSTTTTTTAAAASPSSSSCWWCAGCKSRHHHHHQHPQRHRRAGGVQAASGRSSRRGGRTTMMMVVVMVVVVLLLLRLPRGSGNRRRRPAARSSIGRPARPPARHGHSQSGRQADHPSVARRGAAASGKRAAPPRPEAAPSGQQSVAHLPAAAWSEGAGGHRTDHGRKGSGGGRLRHHIRRARDVRGRATGRTAAPTARIAQGDGGSRTLRVIGSILA
eukprot:scaffold1950_cov366-Prasinococcus_capsulatus_cf.AAC.3